MLQKELAHVYLLVFQKSKDFRVTKRFEGKILRYFPKP